MRTYTLDDHEAAIVRRALQAKIEELEERARGATQRRDLGLTATPVQHLLLDEHRKVLEKLG